MAHTLDLGIPVHQDKTPFSHSYVGREVDPPVIVVVASLNA